MTKMNYKIIDKDLKSLRKSVDYHIELENGDIFIVNRWMDFYDGVEDTGYEIEVIDDRNNWEELPEETQDEIIDTILDADF